MSGKVDEGKKQAQPGQKIVHRSITGVFDDNVDSPPGSPKNAVKKTPQASRRVSGLWDSNTEAGVAGHRKSIEVREAKEQTEHPDDIDVEGLLNAAVKSSSPIPNMLAALAKYPKVQRLQWMGIEALANMAPGNAEARALIAENGGPKLVVDAMLTFANDEKVQAKGCWAMANGTQDQEDIWVKNGAISALTIATDHASDCASRENVTQKQYDSASSRFMIASRAFKNLIQTKEAAKEAEKCDTAGVLTRGVEVFKKDPMAQWRGQEAIARIVELLE